MGKKEKVLVTGANGLLGAHVIKYLNEHTRYKAVAIVRKGCNLSALEGLDYQLYEGNITQYEELKEIIASCDYVIHCAAMTAVKNAPYEEFHRVNVKSTQYIVQLCQHFAIKRLIFVSTANCFTNGSIAQAGNETRGFMSWLKNSHYAYSKWQAHKYVLQQANSGRLNALAVAPTFMIGERDAGPSSGTLLLYGMKSPVIFFPSGGKSFVDVRHVAKAIVNALQKGKSGESYLLSGTNITYKDFFQQLLKVTGKSKILLPIPSFFLDGAVAVSKIVQKWGNHPGFLEETNRKLLTLDNYFSNQKAKQELGMPATNIRECLRLSLDWYKKKGVL